jgi:ABC-type Fe3+/spermidine/putrescine transport system ATPase subunit
LIISRKESEEGQHYLFGKVIDATFKGPFVHYLIMVEDTQLKVYHSIHEGTTDFRRGETVILTFGRDDVLVLKS